MIHFYLDSNRKNIWATSPRNGSSLTRAIASHNNNLVKLDLRQLFLYLKDNSDATVNVIFRDPTIRFRSGLFINGGSEAGVERDDCNFKNIYKDFLISYSKTSFKINRQFPMYHICDFHLDHTLWISAFFSLYNYNVKLIPISDFTNILVDNFPNSKDIIFSEDPKIKNRGTRAFNSSLRIYDELWVVYNEGLIKTMNEYANKYKIFYTFDDWIDLETKIFKLYEDNHHTQNINSLLKDVMKMIIDDPYYLMDVYSPKVQTIKELIREMLIVDSTKKEYSLKLFDIYNNLNSYSESINRLIYFNNKTGNL